MGIKDLDLGYIILPKLKLCLVSVFKWTPGLYTSLLDLLRKLLINGFLDVYNFQKGKF